MAGKQQSEDMERRKSLIKEPDYGKRVVVGGRSLFYSERGRGPVLLYVHGNLGSHRWFSRVMDVPGFRTLAPDLPNFGFSDRIESAEIEDYSDYLIDFLETLEIPSVHAAGHSLGGAVVQSLAVKRPDMVKSMILIDSGPVKGLHTPEESYPLFEQFKVNYDFLKQSLCAIMPGEKDEDRIAELVGDALLMSHHCFEGHGRTLERFDLSDEAGGSGIPVLVMRGEKDILITSRMAEETAEAWNGTVRLFPESGHSPQVEDPEGFLGILREFIR